VQALPRETDAAIQGSEGAKNGAALAALVLGPHKCSLRLEARFGGAFSLVDERYNVVTDGVPYI
jgi:hypothetical protein